MTDHSTIATANVMVAETPEDIAKIGASLLVAHTQTVLMSKKFVNLVLSGGSTPIPLFQYLATETARSISWDRVRFFWADERVVPPDHPESNFKLANDCLLKPLHIAAENIFRIPVYVDDAGKTHSPDSPYYKDEAELAKSAANEYEKTLHGIFGESLDFDFVFLGLGEDGHTASLFPDAEEQWLSAENQGHWVAPIWVPHLKSYRVSLLPSALSSGLKVYFLVTGDSKAQTLREVLAFNVDQGPPLPAQRIHARISKACWLVDKTAASRLGADKAA